MGRPRDLVDRLDRALVDARRRPDPAGLRPDPAKPEGADCLPLVRHIVVLMMENHSFDNYLGLLGRGDGLPSGADGLPVATNAGSLGPVPARRLRSTTQLKGAPTQSWIASHEQWADGTNAGFVAAVERCSPGVDPAVAMGHWDEDDLPFYFGLARTFPLADRWFASCLGPTIPNRRFMIAGTAHGLDSDQISHCLDIPPGGTIFDLLTRNGISWANYHSVAHARPLVQRLAGVHGVRAGRRLRRLVADAGAHLASDGDRPKSYLQFSADAYPLGLVRYAAHLRRIDQFLDDARTGRLPAVSFVDPDFRATSEENPQDIGAGEQFAAQVINAALRGADWMGTLLIWCYDEHGGYYDHVPPPPAMPPDEVAPEGGGPWGYDRYGFRVPAVIVSPYARPDHVSHVVHDHTSILKLIERKWNLPALTARDARADDLLDSVDFVRPPAFAEPPVLPPPRWTATGHRAA